MPCSSRHNGTNVLQPPATVLIVSAMIPNLLRASFRAQFLLGFAACMALLGYAIYSQLGLGLEPCPLCIFQRVAFVALALVFLAGAVHAPRSQGGRRGYGVIGLIVAAVGIGIAGNHVRLQNVPPEQVPACGPGLDYMLDSMPLTGVVRRVVTGSGECTQIDWTFLGLSMPAWSLIWFVLLAIWVAISAFRRR